MNSNSFVEQPNKIGILIRKAISRQQNDAGLFSTDCQKNSVSKELLSLISMFIDGTEHTSKLSQATLTCAQLILSIYKPNNTGAIDKTTYLSQKRETPFALCNALNLSICMDGCALNVLLPIISIWVLFLLTWKLQKLQNTPQMPCSNNSKIWNAFYVEVHKKFAVIAKDNIDLNSRSSTATMDYGGTSLSLIQMHSEESECTVYDYIHTMDNAIHSLKIDSLPEEYSQICQILQCITHPSAMILWRFKA